MAGVTLRLFMFLKLDEVPVADMGKALHLRLPLGDPKLCLLHLVSVSIMCVPPSVNVDIKFGINQYTTPNFLPHFPQWVFPPTFQRVKGSTAVLMVVSFSLSAGQLKLNPVHL